MPALSLSALLLLFFPLWVYAGCPRLTADEIVRVDKVIDGDTLRLQDGRILRLIGIDTPELNLYSRTPAERGAVQARRWLHDKFKNESQLKLVFAAKRRDDYDRWLAHPLMPTGTLLTEQMLLKGLGSLLLVPPNHELWPCLFAAETRARRAKVGIWSHALPAVPEQSGWQMLRGRVARVWHRGNRVRIWLDGGVLLQAGRRASPEMRQQLTGLAPGTLLFVRGRVYRKEGEWRLWLDRPWQFAKEH